MDDFQDSQRNKKVFEALFGPRGPAEAPLDDFTTHYLYKAIWTRIQLSVPERSMITIAALTALGRDRELVRHIEGALNIGTPPERINEILLHVAHYAGWPAGHNAQCIALEEYRKAPTDKQLQTLTEAGKNQPEHLTRGEAADLIADLGAG